MSTFGVETTGDEVCDAFSTQIEGRTFLITGTSVKGLGAKTATTLAKHAPARLILVSRSKAKVDPVIEEIHAIDPKVTVTFVPCELTDQDAVRQAAATILQDTSIPTIDVLILNAGVMALHEYTVDKHGVEMQLSANHMGHFLLTNLLLPKVLATPAAAASPRVVSLTSHGHRIAPCRLDDLNFREGNEYEPWSAYGQSKTANVLFTVELARRHGHGHGRGRGSGSTSSSSSSSSSSPPPGLQAFAVNPGLITTTGLGLHLDVNSFADDIVAAASKNNPDVPWSMDGQVKNEAQGCASTLAAALDPALGGHSPAYIHDCQVGEPMAYAVDAENAKRLWAYSEEVVGQKF